MSNKSREENESFDAIVVGAGSPVLYASPTQAVGLSVKL